MLKSLQVPNNYFWAVGLSNNFTRSVENLPFFVIPKLLTYDGQLQPSHYHFAYHNSHTLTVKHKSSTVDPQQTSIASSTSPSQPIHCPSWFTVGTFTATSCHYSLLQLKTGSSILEVTYLPRGSSSLHRLFTYWHIQAQCWLVADFE